MKVLDKGFVELVDIMGNDLTVVNSARVSFGNRKEELDDSDVKLIRYLAKNKHDSPFRHPQLQFHIKAPEMVLRQLYKHIVGINYSENPTKDHAWNEMSLRYVSSNETYIPENIRAQAKSAKQGSEGTIDDEDFAIRWRNWYEKWAEEGMAMYEEAVKKGVAKELARLSYSFGVYTEVYWTVSLQAIFHFINLRNKQDAQWEIRQYAEIIDILVAEKFPHSYEAWKEFR